MCLCDGCGDPDPIDAVQIGKFFLCEECRTNGAVIDLGSEFGIKEFKKYMYSRLYDETPEEKDLRQKIQKLQGRLNSEKERTPEERALMENQLADLRAQQSRLRRELNTSLAPA